MGSEAGDAPMEEFDYTVGRAVYAKNGRLYSVGEGLNKETSLAAGSTGDRSGSRNGNGLQSGQLSRET